MSNEERILHLERTVGYQKVQFQEDLFRFKAKYHRYMNACIDNLELCSDPQMRGEILSEMRKFLNRKD